MRDEILDEVLEALEGQAQQCMPYELEPGEKMSYNRLSVETIRLVINHLRHE